MIISIRRLMEYVKIVLLFVVFTVFFYTCIQFLTDVIRPSRPYEKPEGNAVKVASFELESEENGDWYRHRLLQFYQYGE